ncbi:hypothetical protein C8R46DRAFT_258709 [Mycena filopes]|nr:hypothetical protein C8R46DRAFT_258709 [Mycena filopes]
MTPARRPEGLGFPLYTLIFAGDLLVKAAATEAEDEDGDNNPEPVLPPAMRAFTDKGFPPLWLPACPPELPQWKPHWQALRKKFPLNNTYTNESLRAKFGKSEAETVFSEAAVENGWLTVLDSLVETELERTGKSFKKVYADSGFDLGRSQGKYPGIECWTDCRRDVLRFLFGSYLVAAIPPPPLIKWWGYVMSKYVERKKGKAQRQGPKFEMLAAKSKSSAAPGKARTTRKRKVPDETDSDNDTADQPKKAKSAPDSEIDTDDEIEVVDKPAADDVPVVLKPRSMGKTADPEASGSGLGSAPKNKNLRGSCVEAGSSQGKKLPTTDGSVRNVRLFQTGVKQIAPNTAPNPAPPIPIPIAAPHAPTTLAEFLQSIMHIDLSHHLGLLTDRGFTDMALLRTMAVHWEDEDLRAMLRELLTGTPEALKGRDEFNDLQLWALQAAIRKLK